MAKVINLRQARKARDRSARKTEADANAVKHGRTKAERKREETLAARDRQTLDGKKMEPAGKDDDGPS